MSDPKPYLVTVTLVIYADSEDCAGVAVEEHMDEYCIPIDEIHEIKEEKYL